MAKIICRNAIFYVFFKKNLFVVDGWLVSTSRKRSRARRCASSGSAYTLDNKGMICISFKVPGSWTYLTNEIGVSAKVESIAPLF